ncbi:MAG: hypothetical protein U0Q16_15995 [Bryobacteraceae bacterium]
MKDRAVALLLSLLFFALGSLWISKPGLQADESMLAASVYMPETAGLSASVFGRKVPLMQMSYLGSLETWIHGAVFRIWPASAASMRAPSLVFGAATVFLTWWLMRRMAGRVAALFAAALLAVDPSFVWTTRCDWGPVAVQHLLTVGGVCAIAARRVPLGFLLFGLAMWDKSVFAWTAAGLAVAWVACVRKLPGRTAVVMAVAMFALGAYPLIRYNVAFRGKTADQTAHFSASNFPSKAEEFTRTLGGEKLYSYLVRDRGAPGWLPRSGLNGVLFAAAVLASIWIAEARFFVVLTFGAWLAMALTVGGGESAHHIVLLWPWPLCAIAVTLGALYRRSRGAALGIAALACLCSLGVNARYYWLLTHHGADPPWSDAIYGVHRELEARGYGQVWINDWGIHEPLAVLSRGALEMKLSYDLDPVKAAESGWPLVGHAEKWEALKGKNKRMGGGNGLRKEVLAVIPDSTGEPIFEIFRLVRADIAVLPPNSIVLPQIRR